MSQVRTTIKNIISLGSSNVINAILGIILIMYLARYFGPEGFGIYGFVYAFAQILSFSVEFGIYYIITREVARDKSLAMKYILSASIIKILLMLVVFLFIVGIVKLMNISQEKEILIYIISFSLFLTNFSQTFIGIFNAFEKMEYTALTTLIPSIIFVLLSLGVIFSGCTLFKSKIIPVALVLVFAGIINVLISGIICFKKIVKLDLKVKTNLKFLKYLLKESFPLESQQIIALIYMQSFIIFLSMFQGDIATGIFKASYDLIKQLIAIPALTAFALYPVMSKLFVTSENDLKIVIKKATKFLFIICFFITIIGFVFADKIIVFLYGVEFLESIFMFQILIFAFLIQGTFYVVSYSILAANRQKYQTINAFITCVLAIVLNFLFIPTYGAFGAAVSMLLSFICNSVLYFYFSNIFTLKIRASEIRNLIKPFIVIIVIGIVTTATFFYLLNFNLFVACVASTVFYFASTYFTKIISEDDVKIMKSIVKK
ncbi:MAG: hypothetical protein COZ53_02760 [Candidatus Altarchaeum sp. CG_4_8_14_3_um_filter_33_2054]|nr:MAG: hypothetical protein COZ53_02760 [Candidatus Altarchaeum sp. CG_4_8_14_3_um_filter_33_2054]